MSALRAENLSPIARGDWTRDRAAHLLERAGFGGTPAEIERLVAMSPAEAVASLVAYGNIDDVALPRLREIGALGPLADHLPGQPPGRHRTRRTHR